mmetsp:Transcript_47716/g.102260  ORF Transcript_47716/g.102260 Transcript_47716/m.102260 type:complete len:347 (+) Transcript_47716:163-1203(+)
MSDSKEKPKVPSTVGAGKYNIEVKLGAGCFGEVYKGVSTENQKAVAVKFEAAQSRSLQLGHEAEILNILRKPTLPQGVAELFFFGQEGNWHVLVMEVLGKSLEDRMEECKSSQGLTVQSVVLIADQVIRRIEYLHSKGIVHRDIKPENFMFGINSKIHHLYIIDFGLGKKYFDFNRHIVMRTNLSLTGTARYASINAHKGVEQSRRDDLQAIGHMLIYFLRGSLPWSGLAAKTQEEKYRKIREKKESTPLDKLCQGFPDAFEQYLKITRDMDFQERPKYNALRKLFSNVREQQGPAEDHGLQWLADHDCSNLTPLVHKDDIAQPDDTTSAPKKGYGCCWGKPNVRN